jgi:hypothetical protein
MLLVAGERLSRASVSVDGLLSAIRPIRIPARIVHAAVEDSSRSVYVVVSQAGAQDVSILQLTRRM